MDSKIILSKGIHIDRDYKNVTSLSTSEMLAVMQTEAHYVASSNKFSFIRMQNKLSTPFSYDDCIQSNYIAFQNPSYSDYWFFAFIDDVYYKSDGCTEITYTVDAWTTFFGEWTAKPCMTIREHVADDTIGLHTIEEGLDTGDDFVEEAETTLSGFSDYFYVAVETNYLPNDNSHPRAQQTDTPDGQQYSGVTVHNKNVFGATIALFDSHVEDASHGAYTFAYNLHMFLHRVNDDEHIGDIRNMYIVPSSLIPASALISHTCYASADTSIPINYDELKGSLTAKTFTQNIAKQHTFTGLTVKNNKCFCYPYNFIECTNNSGNRQIYKYEQFSNANNATFKIALAIICGCSGLATPTNYKNQLENHDESIALGKFPTCSWSADSYTNYLTQESINNLKNVVFKTGSAISGILGAEDTESAIGSGLGGLASLSSVAFDVWGQKTAREMSPENYAGSNNGSVNFSENLLTFVWKNKRVKNENMKAIDDYFTKFGYKVARLKTPELHSRTYWNYVEIAQSEDIGFGDVPTIYMEQINNACRRGLTIWHNHENIGNYNLNNTII